MQIDGSADHWDHRVDDDHWEQPGNLFRMMTVAQKEALFGNTARAMGDASLEIKLRHIGNCSRADPAYGAGVAAALGINAVSPQNSIGHPALLTVGSLRSSGGCRFRTTSHE